jgi:hypothetical protein
MGTKSIVVATVISPGMIRDVDGTAYVLRGVPDVEDGHVQFAAAKDAVAAALNGRELLYEEERARELPDLPGMEIEALTTDGKPVTPGLAARVAGILVGHPFT